MPDLSASSWNESDPLNNATPPGGWPEGQMPATVNDCARQMMGAMKRWWNRSNPAVSASGASGAYTYATTSTLFPTAYSQGEVFSFKAPFTSVGGDTFAVNSLTALPIYSRTGAGTLHAIAAGDIQSDTYVTLAYDSVLNGGGGGFQLTSGGGSAPINSPSFGGTVTITNLQITSAATGVTMPAGDGSNALATDAFVHNYVSGNYLPLAGGTSGGVTLSGGNISGAGSANFSGNVVGNNSVQSNGVYFQNNSGWFYTPQNFFSGGAVGVGGSTGIYWTNNGGWMYCPVGMWSANINTGGITCGNISAGGNSITGGTFNTGNVLPQADGGYFCGASALAWAASEAYVFYTKSSLALKEGIETIERAACADIIERLRPVTFRYKALKDKTTHCGFIAEEVRASLAAAGIDACERDGSLAYSELIPLLLGAVQELTRRLEALEMR